MWMLKKSNKELLKSKHFDGECNHKLCHSPVVKPSLHRHLLVILRNIKTSFAIKVMNNIK